MDEYIERSAGVSILRAKANMAVLMDAAPYFEKAAQMLEKLPAADVAPVVHGWWENGNPICPVCGGDKFKDLDADIWCDWKPDYCPNCGAKMDGGADHADD